MILKDIYVLLDSKTKIDVYSETSENSAIWIGTMERYSFLYNCFSDLLEKEVVKIFKSANDNIAITIRW